jgi:feruloyl esterase
MFAHIPKNLADGSPLVVVLHGCTQNAASYDLGAGWSTLADRYGFALVLPEQQRANNPNLCFNWFETEDIRRGGGEALSIRQMVDKMKRDYRIDPRRVYVTGLSAGGAMTSVMLASYPDVFAGGAIIAGLPYGAASNVQEAFESMFQSPKRPARAWGDLVREASPHAGPWPRVSVWHGGADATVIPSNAVEIVKQWTDVHGLPGVPLLQEIVDGHPRQVWRNDAGEDVIESYSIRNMAHGTPLAVGNADDQCGVAGAFLLDVGISSSYHIAKFWGLIGVPRTAKAEAEIKLGAADLPRREGGGNDSARPRPIFPGIDLSGLPHSGPANIRAVIVQALEAAGLMKTSQERGERAKRPNRDPHDGAG